MLSYHNDEALKLKFQDKFAKHRELDEVIQGQFFADGRSRFVSCVLDKGDHPQFEVELGWPQWMANLAENIFEALPEEEAPQFGTLLLAATPVGKNLEVVRWMLAIFRHQEQLERLQDIEEEYAVPVREALQKVIDYCRSRLFGPGDRSLRSAAITSAYPAFMSAPPYLNQSVLSARTAAASAYTTVERAHCEAWEAGSVLSSARSAARSLCELNRKEDWSQAQWFTVWATHFQKERDWLLYILRSL
jgi:hypothetical protein